MRWIKKFLELIFLIFVILILCAGFCVFYAFKIEPYRVKTTEYNLYGSDNNTGKAKVVLFSDLHIKEDFTCENLEKIVNEINAQDPDIVVFTGDLYDNYAVYNDDEGVISRLSAIDANYEKIAVWGNRDYGGGAAGHYEYIMKQSGFTLLKNENWYVTVDGGKTILFTGLDDSTLGEPWMPDSTKIYNSDYDILLTHEPDTARNYVDYRYDITLSGHSHGGQIDVPLLPEINDMALAATNLATDFGGGMYDLTEDGNSKLYVNTGIGTTHISARFGVVPEVTVFYLSL